MDIEISNIVDLCRNIMTEGIFALWWLYMDNNAFLLFVVQKIGSVKAVVSIICDLYHV